MSTNSLRHREDYLKFRIEAHHLCGSLFPLQDAHIAQCICEKSGRATHPALWRIRPTGLADDGADDACYDGHDHGDGRGHGHGGDGDGDDYDHDGYDGGGNDNTCRRYGLESENLFLGGCFFWMIVGRRFFSMVCCCLGNSRKPIKKISEAPECGKKYEAVGPTVQRKIANPPRRRVACLMVLETLL